MKLNLRSTGCHLPYGLTQWYLSHDTSEHTRPNPSQTSRYSIGEMEGSGWVDLCDQLHTEMVYPHIDVISTNEDEYVGGHSSKYTNLSVHVRESNLWLVDHKSDALTTTPSEEYVRLQKKYGLVHFHSQYCDHGYVVLLCTALKQIVVLSLGDLC